MPVTAMVSAKQILARVIRSTGYKLPSTYHDDILEWLPEAMGLLQVTNSLVVTSTSEIDCPGEIWTKNHCAPLPCGFVSVMAVEDERGLRLPEGGDVTDFKTQTSARHTGNTPNNIRPNVFEVNPYVHQTSDGLPTDEAGDMFPFLGEDLERVDVSGRTKHYYKIQGNYIQTSFECGFIRIHYLAVPTDKDGYPMIPDNENFKQAMEWHIIRRLIGSGYQHPVFKYQYAEEQFDKYAARGMAEVSYPSLDTMARIHHGTVRLIPPYHFHEDFFINSEQSERLNK